MTEADLYDPIKRYLQAQGYEVKGEVGACDVVAVRGDEDPVVVELKENLNFALVLQAVDRMALTDSVYLAFRTGPKHSATWRSRRKKVLALLRRVGLGLLTVSPKGKVTAELDPGPYQPRLSKPKRRRLLKEFAERVGDPEVGGSSPRQRLTAYRQAAIQCAQAMADQGVMKPSELRDLGVERAAPILQQNHYGWFERVERGVYELTPKGERELREWSKRMADVS